jgi:predicted transcriptional regulator
MSKGFRQLERIVRGFSNHRRIQMLETLDARPDLELMALARACGVNVKTAGEHTRRLAAAGLILKRSKGRATLHAISPRGKEALAYLRSVE